MRIWECHLQLRLFILVQNARRLGGTQGPLQILACWPAAWVWLSWWLTAVDGWQKAWLGWWLTVTMGWVVGLMVDRDRVFQRRCCPFFSLIFPSLTEMARKCQFWRKCDCDQGKCETVDRTEKFYIENYLKQHVRNMQVDLEGGSNGASLVRFPNSQQEGRGIWLEQFWQDPQPKCFWKTGGCPVYCLGIISDRSNSQALEPFTPNMLIGVSRSWK